MPRHPLRRGQLVVPFGVGSIVTFPDGVSLMIAGLDHWYDPPKPGAVVDRNEFIIDEWRLEERLLVDHLRLPPDHRPWYRNRDQTANLDMTIPAVRFPRMHVCAFCQRLDRRSLTEYGKLRCQYCERANKWAPLNQVQFLAMCEAGHVQDFPFREWAHRDPDPVCRLPMKLYGSAGASLVSVFVRCQCGARRNLAGITETFGSRADGGTVLSRRLGNGSSEPFTCPGVRPWLGAANDEGCGLELRGGLRSAANTYFAETMSSVYVPREQTGVPPELMTKLEAPPVSTWLRILRDAGSQPTPQMLRDQYPGLVPDGVRDEALERALKGPDAIGASEPDQSSSPSSITEAEFRQVEYEALRAERNGPRLHVRQIDLAEYESWVQDHFGGVALVERLRVTKAFTGFGRIVSPEGRPLDERIKTLWAEPPPPKKRWLPAAVVNGEGVFLRLNEERLSGWEGEPSVIERVARLDHVYSQVASRRRLPDRSIAPRLVLLHTLAHVLIDRLAFHSGYTAASLAERLYASSEHGMSGLLIYTAAGDSEGTLGGLVRLGRPDALEDLVVKAIASARWCSSDPVCMELGESGGQGPDSCNLAGCHDCAILPETSCEEFNRFLDRAVLVGAPGDVPGYFEAIS